MVSKQIASVNSRNTFTCRMSAKYSASTSGQPAISADFKQDLDECRTLLKGLLEGKSDKPELETIDIDGQPAETLRLRGGASALGTGQPIDLSNGIKTRGKARAIERSIAGPSGNKPVKLKLSTNIAKTGLYRHFMGNYERELDDDPNEALMFEEQFILRVPEQVALGNMATGTKGLAEIVGAKREIPGVAIKFKGNLMPRV